MLDSVLNTIEKYNMLSENDRVVAAVSGGPDSIALLHVLYVVKDKYGLYLHVAHLNHMLRGDESEGDTAYVRDFCRKFNIPCTVRYVDINEMAKKEGLSHEEAGRKARYQLFEDTVKEVRASKIALAHNMNDQAETVLMRIMRGTGLDGLCGIKPVREGLYIRPLLFTLRAEIEKYCEENNLNPRIDSTNLESIYSRNKIRLQLIPYIRQNYASNIESSLSSMAELLREDSDFLEGYVKGLFNKLAQEIPGGVSIVIEDFRRLHTAIKRRMVRAAVERIKGNLIGIESKHIELILQIVNNGSTGSAVELPKGITARVSYGHLNIMVYRGETNVKFRYIVSIPGRTLIKESGDTIDAEIIDGNSVQNYKDNKFIKYFDYDKIKDTLVVRQRAEGDYIVPIGMRGKKKLKDLFIDSKIPREHRDRIPVIAVDKEILWVIGYKISDNYKITKDTVNVLKLQYTKLGGDTNA